MLAGIYYRISLYRCIGDICAEVFVLRHTGQTKAFHISVY